MENNINVNEDKKNKLYPYIFYFFIFSFLGWLMETIYSFIMLGHFTNRGFLYGPLCPIYGWGATILILFLSKYKDNSLKLFFYAGVIFSTFEYYVSYVLEALFKEHWWDYTNDFLNLNGRISIFYSIAWGVIAIIFIGHVYPFFAKKVKFILSKLSSKVKDCLVYSVLTIYIVDTILSCIEYLPKF